MGTWPERNARRASRRPARMRQVASHGVTPSAAGTLSSASFRRTSIMITATRAPQAEGQHRDRPLDGTTHGQRRRERHDRVAHVEDVVNDGGETTASRWPVSRSPQV